MPRKKTGAPVPVQIVDAETLKNLPFDAVGAMHRAIVAAAQDIGPITFPQTIIYPPIAVEVQKGDDTQIEAWFESHTQDPDSILVTTPVSPSGLKEDPALQELLHQSVGERHMIPLQTLMGRGDCLAVPEMMEAVKHDTDYLSITASVPPGLHACAPNGMKCSDCTIDKHPCSDCYLAFLRSPELVVNPPADGWRSVSQMEDAMVFRRIAVSARAPIPPDMKDYLLTLISPPKPHDPALFLGELEYVDFEKVKLLPNEVLTGIIVRGTPTEEQSAALLRVLKPGAHLLLIAPDEQPTGHTGACRIEDAGFEIRDSILWVRDAQNLHYVPKASRSEREAGCEMLPARKVELSEDEKTELARLAALDVDELTEEEQEKLEELTEKTENQSGIRNHHPTVKPKELMERLLRNVPKEPDLPVLDLFHGSGTTGLACLATGHDFVGIDLEPEYLAIQTARMKHWHEKIQGDRYHTIQIDSDVELPSTDDQPSVDFLDW